MCVPVRRGSVALFWSLTPHMTGPNQTDRTRKAYIVQYAADGWNNRIWDKRGDSGAGAPVGSSGSGPSPVEEDRNFFVLRGGCGVRPTPVGMPDARL